MSDDPVRSVILPASVWRGLWILWVADLVEAARDDKDSQMEEKLAVLAVLQRAAMGFMDQDSEMREFWSETRQELKELGYELTSDHVSTAAMLVG